MEEKIEEIASRVRELRKLSKVSVEDMAECLKVPVETYGCYEDGTLDIPASKLIEIGQRFGVDMNLLLTGEEPRMRIFTVTRRDEGIIVERRKQYKYQNLAGKFVHKKVEPFLVTIEPWNGLRYTATPDRNLTMCSREALSCTSMITRSY